jgi:anthranilate 1,2-dioxygenase small subunit
MISIDARFAVYDLLALATNLLDRDALEEWIECFTEAGAYRVLSRENVERNLPLPLFRCDSKDMIRDRVLSLRKANVTNLHRDRHVVGPAQLSVESDGFIRAESGFALYQSTHDGTASLFSLGVYLDRIHIHEQVARFVERHVIVDLFSVPTMLSTPI